MALRLWESSKNWWRYDQMKFVTAKNCWERYKGRVVETPQESAKENGEQ